MRSIGSTVARWAGTCRSVERSEAIGSGRAATGRHSEPGTGAEPGGALGATELCPIRARPRGCKVLPAGQGCTGLRVAAFVSTKDIYSG